MTIHLFAVTLKHTIVLHEVARVLLLEHALSRLRVVETGDGIFSDVIATPADLIIKFGGIKLEVVQGCRGMIMMPYPFTLY